RSGGGEYNFRPVDATPSGTGKEGPLAAWAGTVGTDWLTYTRERPGMSAFALEDGIVHHTYSAYARGLDGLWGMYQWLDRAPRGENSADRGRRWVLAGVVAVEAPGRVLHRGDRPAGEGVGRVAEAGRLGARLGIRDPHRR